MCYLLPPPACFSKQSRHRVLAPVAIRTFPISGLLHSEQTTLSLNLIFEGSTAMILGMP